MTDPAQTPAVPAAVPKITYGLPVRLIIPKIGVNAPVEKVGLTSGRDMASPSGPDTVGWYKFGPRPGNKGSAVIDGHSGYADDREAAFDDLPKLKVGDKLVVKDAAGKRLVFVVRRTKLYARNASAAGVFASTTSRRLNLITCTGSSTSPPAPTRSGWSCSPSCSPERRLPARKATRSAARPSAVQSSSRVTAPGPSRRPPDGCSCRRSGFRRRSGCRHGSSARGTP